MAVGTPATVALDAAGIRYWVHTYDHDPSVSSFGLEAATALGIEPERMFKTRHQRGVGEYRALARS